MKRTIDIWHGVKHDDYAVTTAKTDRTFCEFIQSLRDYGGLVYEDVFIPWHRINYIEVTKKEEQGEIIDVRV